MDFQSASHGARRRSVLALVAMAGIAASSLTVRGSEPQPAGAVASSEVIFSTPLQDIPGKNLVASRLVFPATSKHIPVDHRHPGSVYVYVTRGTLRLGIQGEPVREVHAGESFFEPPGALHTVAESASPTESAEAIAVLIVPNGAPLTTPEGKKK
jgi:quercetin dioxygenase-like cupin family protein